MQRPAPTQLYHGQTHQGRVRDHNEDVFGTPGHFAIPGERCTSQGTLLVVCDGMGGRAAGEEASRLALATIFETFYADPRSDRRSALEASIHAANAAVYTAGQDNTEWTGMGTTAVSFLFLGELVVVAHAGDSRAYLLHNNVLTCLTADHTWVAESVAAGILTPEEAAQSIYRHALTRAVGLEPSVNVAVSDWQPVAPGDRYLLCSDGLTNEVPDEALGAIVARGDAAAVAAALVKQAYRAGGHDNITALVATVPGGRTAPPARDRLVLTPMTVAGCVLIAVLSVVAVVLSQNASFASARPTAGLAIRGEVAEVASTLVVKDHTHTPTVPPATSTIAPSSTPETATQTTMPSPTLTPEPSGTRTSSPSPSATSTSTSTASPTATPTATPALAKTGLPAAAPIIGVPVPPSFLDARAHWRELRAECKDAWYLWKVEAPAALVKKIEGLRLKCQTPAGSEVICELVRDSLAILSDTATFDYPPGIGTAPPYPPPAVSSGTMPLVWFSRAEQWDLSLLGTEWGATGSMTFHRLSSSGPPPVEDGTAGWLIVFGQPEQNRGWRGALLSGAWQREITGSYRFAPDPASLFVPSEDCTFRWYKAVQ